MHIHIYRYMYMYIYIYVYIYICIHICIYTHICTYTYIHLFADCRRIFYFSPKKRYINRKKVVSTDHQSPQPSMYIDKCITVSHFGEHKRLHPESSKQNYSIISLRAIIKAIFTSLLCTPIQSTCILRFSRSGFFRSALQVSVPHLGSNQVPK